MKEIGSGPSYRVEVDTLKNRIYFSFFGDALGEASVAGLIDAVEAACALMKPGFTSLADFTEMKLLGLPDVARETQVTISHAGVRKVASIWNHESFAKIVVDSSAEKVMSGEYSEKRKVFTDRAEGEAWLND
jgi:hypothetical protein